MMTSIECTAKADELDLLSKHCQVDDMRAMFARIAVGWRRTAVLARQQEDFLVLHPLA